jgi:hypothetical protein
MAKTIGLKQLEQKQYTIIEGVDPDVCNCIGIVEDTFDMIFYGNSGNGKTNATAIFLKAILKALLAQMPSVKCEYVAYEEGHAMTIQETFINRHKYLEELGNVMLLTDHYTFNELVQRMRKRKSAKIWVIDSLQAARFTEQQCADLKREFVNGKKKKIIIWVSWAEASGKVPHGSTAKAVEYYANIKLRVQGLVVFPKTRYERNGIGNKRYVIYEPGARVYWGDKYDEVVHGTKPKKARQPKKATKAKGKEAESDEPLAEPVTKAQIAEPETEEEKEQRLVKQLKESA